MSNATQSLAGTRITSLLDANSFVEIGKSVTARSTDFNLTETKAPSDGVITGYGVIDGNLVYVYSQDASVLNGTVGEMHARKITALYDLAMKTGAPVIGLVDCAGMRLQEATDALEAFGSIYLKQTLASGMIPQITAVFGTCGGGMAVIRLTDFTFMESKKENVRQHQRTGRNNTENAIQQPADSRARDRSVDASAEEDSWTDPSLITSSF
ncbi:MAG: carboxyl transferase domain-containing protein [Blautia obeum]